MDPVSMFLMAMQAGGKLFAGFQGSSLDKMQADIQAGNGRLYSTQADTALLDQGLALTKGAYGETQVDRTVQRTLGGDVAGAAARNLNPLYGSPLVTQMLSIAQGQTDKALVGAQAQLEASNAVARAASIKNQAASAYYASYGSSKKSVTDLYAGLFGAGGAILGGMKGFDFGGGGAGGGGKGAGYGGDIGELMPAGNFGG